MAQPGPRGSRPDEQLSAVDAPADPPADAPADPPADAPADPPAGDPADVPAAPGPKLSPAESRALKFTARNMVWSLLPLTVLVLVMVGWIALRQPDNPVHPVEISTAEYLAAQRAAYPLLVPQGLDPGWMPTSVRTDAGNATTPGDPVTLQIGWYTPEGEYAGYVISDDAAVGGLTGVLHDATPHGTVQVGGQTWQRLTTLRGETALTRTEGTATLLVTGSASEEELETLAGAVGPYRAP
jgi:hypothetical protein